MTRGERWAYAITVVVIIGLFAVELAIDFAPVKLSALFFVLAWAPLLALHEAGHAACARVLGYHVDAVVIGFGRTLWSGTISGIDVDVRLAPIEGFTRYHACRDGRIRKALVAFAGPGAELLLAGILLAVLGPDTMFAASESPLVIAGQSVALAAVVGAIINLIPMEVQRDKSPDEPWLANDGRAIILSLLGRR